jgi:hypothetical protein
MSQIRKIADRQNENENDAVILPPLTTLLFAGGSNNFSYRKLKINKSP